MTSPIKYTDFEAVHLHGYSFNLIGIKPSKDTWTRSYPFLDFLTK